MSCREPAASTKTHQRFGGFSPVGKSRGGTAIFTSSFASGTPGIAPGFGKAYSLISESFPLRSFSARRE